MVAVEVKTRRSGHAYHLDAWTLALYEQILSIECRTKDEIRSRTERVCFQTRRFRTKHQFGRGPVSVGKTSVNILLNPRGTDYVNRWNKLVVRVTGLEVDIVRRPGVNATYSWNYRERRNFGHSCGRPDVREGRVAFGALTKRNGTRPEE